MTQVALDAQAAELLLRGAVIGGAAGLAFAFGRAAAGAALRVIGVLLAVGVACWAVVSIEGPAPFVLSMGADLTVATLWPFAVLIFGAPREWAGRPAILALPGALLALLWIAELSVGHAPLLHALHNAVEVTVAALTILTVLFGRAGDTDAARRRLRGPFVALVGGFVILLAVAGDRPGLGQTAAWNVAEAVAALALVLAGLALFSVPRPGLVARPAPLAPPAAPDPDAGLLGAIEAAMGPEEAWREEGLTIGGLAARLGTTEHRLRAVINGRLGHRNFPGFVNGYRLAEAERRLADPAEAARTVAEIAYACGFGSLGPFGRAFKARTGLTPTAWRERALGGAPIPRRRADSEQGAAGGVIGETGGAG